MSETLDLPTIHAAFAARAPIAASPTGGPFLAVRTTGVFCRIGCPARTPKLENCEAFADASSALEAGYRACQRCHPQNATEGPDNRVIRAVVRLVEASETRVTEDDLRRAGIDPDTARRRFQKRLGISAMNYVRLRALARAAKTLSAGGSVTEAQLDADFDSPSGFRAAYAQVLGAAPSKPHLEPLMVDWCETPLGRMIVIGDDARLYLIEFTGSPSLRLTRQFARLAKLHRRPLLPGTSETTRRAAAQVAEYFAGDRHDFSVPLEPSGTAFQKTVWAALQTIPYGDTWSYAQLAAAIGRDSAHRAVASANGSNGLALLIPCHRVIASGGGLGGYAGGLDRKRALLQLEGAPGFAGGTLL